MGDRVPVLADFAIVLLGRVAGMRHGLAGTVFAPHARIELDRRVLDRGLRLPMVVGRDVALRQHSDTQRLAVSPLVLGALASGPGVAQALFGDPDLAAQRGHLLVLCRHYPRQLAPPCVGGRTVAMRRLATTFRLGRRRVTRRDPRPEVCRRGIESGQLLTRRVELAGGERQIDHEPSGGQLGMAFGPPPLARERAHLRLHLTQQIIQPREIDRRLLESALRRPSAIAI